MPPREPKKRKRPVSSPSASTKNPSNKRRGRRVDKQMLAELYAILYTRIPRPIQEATLSKEFSDKELRVLMKHNGMLINDYDQKSGSYQEKTKTTKCKILVAAAPTMLVPSVNGVPVIPLAPGAPLDQPIDLPFSTVARGGRAAAGGSRGGKGGRKGRASGRGNGARRVKSDKHGGGRGAADMADHYSLPVHGNSTGRPRRRSGARKVYSDMDSDGGQSEEVDDEEEEEEEEDEQEDEDEEEAEEEAEEEDEDKDDDEDEDEEDADVDDQDDEE